jgi:hypothetical protein
MGKTCRDGESNVCMTEFNNKVGGNLIVFHHIPKTAGTSIIELLRRNFSAEELLLLYGHEGRSHRDSFASAITNKDVKLRCVALHNPEEIVPIIPGQYRCFTMLRDPVERVVSLYHYALKVAHRYPQRDLPGQAILRNCWTLGDIYKELGEGYETSSDTHRIFREFFNGATRSLLAMQDTKIELGFFEDLNRTLMNQVLEFLRAKYVVGITEAFQLSVNRFARCFNWSVITYPRERIYDRMCETPGPTRELIRRYNRIDSIIHKEYVDAVCYPVRCAAHAPC